MQSRSLRRQKTKHIFGIIVAIAGVLTLVIVGYEMNWMRFISQYSLPEKTSWDWIQVLLLPAVIMLATLLFIHAERTNRQKDTQLRNQNERVIAINNQSETALQAYLNRMSELLLEENARVSAPGTEIWNVARALTLTLLRRLDAGRKGNVLQFLHEAGFIHKNAGKSMLDLSGADLSGADLNGAKLSGAVLSGALLVEADLSEADFMEANLNVAILSGADLSGANLSGANLNGANLNGANLSKAILDRAYLNEADLKLANLNETGLGEARLKEADLSNATLRSASLGGADLSRAILKGADLSGADLSGAIVSGVDLTRANLSGATVGSQQLDNAKTRTTALPHPR
ncbi:MAG TPA: pentapeptide repeat-containing protein [Ktedonobacteraceae bacterium]|nr:pentapeptide repeat-containing protein [Ktedonobacteraceae bacterium]